MDVVSVRYIVDDVAAARDFYVRHLGFVVEVDAAPGFAMLDEALRLLLNAPGGRGGAAAATPDGQVPAPGGWNRFQLVVADLDAEVERLRAAGLRFRTEVAVGVGGSQILLEDPAGNAVELFQPAG
ncbi:glyoxalase [Pseudonocardia sp. CNS-139]|nr:glyoxalase [Pseudonocardia sp. CNS-139]